eukprot:c4869_g1_i1.p1 GENE.c4869_g1_i1~~c4869_g1_i1.p1  ORF type:complete len:743 (+),score=185.47 c4869_g1_i1:46-2229(+)
MLRLGCCLAFSVLLVRGLTPIDYVDPLSGTAHSCQGNVFPAVGSPSAMTHWTPDTTGNQTKCVAPYYYEANTLVGFRGTHFISGSCMQDFGSFTIMPMTKSLRVLPEDRATPFSHSQESSKPHLYQVQLPLEGLNVSLTGTVRSGMLQATSTALQPTTMFVLIQPNYADGFPNDTSITVFNQTVYASSLVRRAYMQAGEPAGFSGYIAIRFSRAPNAVRIVTVQHNTCLYAVFQNVSFGESVTLSMGTSFTSGDAALANMQTEIASRAFDDVAAETLSVWQTSLGHIRVAGGEEEHLETLYSSLYRSLLLPRIYTDVAGTFPPFSGVGGVDSVTDHQYYDDFSMWDIFRAQLPLLSIVYPSKLRDIVWSLSHKAHTGGWLPIFPAWNSYTQEMIGDHAAVVMADAFVKGIVDKDFISDAYTYMRQNAFDTPSRADYVDGKGRRALGNYTRYGYVPLDDPVMEAFHKGEQVSRTIEYSYDDYVLSIVASALNHTADATALLNRSSNWKNVFNNKGFVCGRFANGSWTDNCDPTQKQHWLTEESGWVWSFCVPHDISGLAQIMGGSESFISKLDYLFDNGLYDQGNEPSHHTAYAYVHVGAPAKTQERIAFIVRANYSTGPDGLSGNDDAGQMSAWLVMSAIGFYQVVPGVPQYTIGTPLFDQAELDVVAADGSAKVFRVTAVGRSEQAIYVQKAELNGNEMEQLVLSHSDVVSGGELKLYMSATSIAM